MSYKTNNLVFKESGFKRSGGEFIKALNLQAVTNELPDSVTRVVATSMDTTGIDVFTTEPATITIQAIDINENLYRLLNSWFNPFKNGGDFRVDFFVNPKEGSKDLSGIAYIDFSIKNFPSAIQFSGDEETHTIEFEITGSSFSIVQYGVDGEVL